MIVGVGVDMVDMREFERLCDMSDGAFVRRTFTNAEREAAMSCAKPREHLAGCFATKEAVYKAVVDNLPEKTFDMRIVEQLNRDSGAPYVNVMPELAEVLAHATISALHVSITNEGGYAVAFVVAER